MRRLVVVVAALAVAVLLGVADGAAAPAQSPTLSGASARASRSRSRTRRGHRVTQLDPGTYDIDVEDQSDFHNFHLTGPGVDRATDVDVTGHRDAGR